MDSQTTDITQFVDIYRISVLFPVLMQGSITNFFKAVIGFVPGFGLGAVLENGWGLPIVNTYHQFVHSLALVKEWSLEVGCTYL